MLTSRFEVHCRCDKHELGTHVIKRSTYQVLGDAWRLFAIPSANIPDRRGSVQAQSSKVGKGQAWQARLGPGQACQVRNRAQRQRWSELWPNEKAAASNGETEAAVDGSADMRQSALSSAAPQKASPSMLTKAAAFVEASRHQSSACPAICWCLPVVTLRQLTGDGMAEPRAMHCMCQRRYQYY